MFDPRKYTLPIFNFDQGTPDLHGTGVLIQANSHRFIITAAHVLESGFKNVAFGFPTPTHMELFGADDLPMLVAKAQSNGGDPQLAEYKDGLDLAVILPTPPVMARLEEHYEFYDLNENADAPDKWFMVAGWPCSQNEWNERTRKCEFKGCYLFNCPQSAPDRIESIGGIPQVHFALEFNQRKDFIGPDGNKTTLPALNGMSGGGVWAMRESDVGAYPNCGLSLSGIIVEHHKGRQLAKVIRVERLWAPLRKWLERLPASAS